MRTFVHIFVLLSSIHSALTHSTFQELWVDGVDQAGTCARLPLSNSPVTSVTSNDIRCNAGTTPVSTLCNAAGNYPPRFLGLEDCWCRVTAGGNLTVEMHAQPNDRSCANQAIGGNHYGPVMVYMSKVADATTNLGDGEWFKVDEEGYNPTSKIWGTVRNLWTSLPSGSTPSARFMRSLYFFSNKYVGRFEYQLWQAKFYCSCRPRAG